MSSNKACVGVGSPQGKESVELLHEVNEKCPTIGEMQDADQVHCQCI